MRKQKTKPTEPTLPAPNVALTATERTELAHEEEIIKRGFHNFLEVGAALLRIKNRRLYRGTHRTFEAYCQDRFEMTRMNAYRQINAAEVCALLPNGDTPRPTNEAQLRPLTTVPRDQASALWLQVVKASNGERITGRAVQKVVQRWKHRSEAEASSPLLAYWQEYCLRRLQKIRKQILSDEPDNIIAELNSVRLIIEQIVLGKSDMADD